MLETLKASEKILLFEERGLVVGKFGKKEPKAVGSLMIIMK